MRGFTRVWVYVKPTVSEEKLVMLENFLEKHGFQVAIHSACPFPSNSPRLSPEQAVKWADFALVVGGDGTLLKVFHETRGVIPLLGVNSGDSLGFLMEVTLDNAIPALQLVAQGKYTIENRLVGEAVIGGWRSIFANEAAILTSRCGVLLRARVLLDDELVMEGRLDGLIVATPTGSTAYALSAGGAILDPLLEAFIVTPLAPFSALLKPFVASATRKLTVVIEGGCSVVIDGALTSNFSNCEIMVAKSLVSLKLIKVNLGEKLKLKLMRRLLDLVPAREETLERHFA
ncbi:MAG: NAD(+)/NADH kinase [Thermofilaceae archaeon]